MYSYINGDQITSWQHVGRNNVDYPIRPVYYLYQRRSTNHAVSLSEAPRSIHLNVKHRVAYSAFTLATCAATCCRTCSATCGQCESTIKRFEITPAHGNIPRSACLLNGPYVLLLLFSLLLHFFLFSAPTSHPVISEARLYWISLHTEFSVLVGIDVTLSSCRLEIHMTRHM